ncbi:hypothetical protein PS15m_007065 [Mucor circinelloides]
MGEENVVATPAGVTLSSVQVAAIAMGIIACSSFVLAVYVWSRSLLNQRRERMLGNATTTTAAAAEVEALRQDMYRQHHTHDYALSTIHDASLLQQQSTYTRNTAYFTHNGLPLPPTYKSRN